MKALFIHAHFDDYEFTAAGTFELWRRKWGKDFRGRVLVCTDGKAGHHARTREETGRIRLQEQHASARVGGYEFELLRLPNLVVAPHIASATVGTRNAMAEICADNLLAGLEGRPLPAWVNPEVGPARRR